LNDLLLSIIAVAAYALAWGTLWHTHVRADQALVRLPPATALAGVAALLLHALLLERTVLSPAGLHLGLFQAISLTGWAMTLLQMGAALLRPAASLGFVVLPIAAAGAVAGAALPSGPTLPEHLGAGIEAHIATSVLSASTLGIATCQAIALYVQERRLRARRSPGLSRFLPPLQLQESLLVQLLAAGFFLLSLSLATGIVFIENLFAQHLVHKTVLSIVAWLTFATLLAGRWYLGWRGRTLTRWTLTGYGVLLLAYFGTKLVLEIVLGRSWVGP